tara:strand:+ start:435 stop:1742 length:1308 start_codon:yes stop_codon:yes gene_type:complete
MIEVIPSLFILGVTGLALTRLKHFPISQIYILFVVAYTSLFPALDLLMSPFPLKGAFGFHQSMFAIFFILPLILFILMRSRFSIVTGNQSDDIVNLNTYSPIILSASAIVFLVAALAYNLFFVRLGYGEFLQIASSTPNVVRYHYRMAVETSFFVIIYLTAIIRSYPDARFIGAYKVTLGVYILVFGAFFLVNSRMQFLLLVILLLASNYKTGIINFRRLAKLGVMVVALAISLTLLRELFIEQNNRLDVSSFMILIRETVWLIASRLNSVVMIDTAGQGLYNPFIPNLDGLWFLIKFNLAAFNDPAYYEYMKAIQITSPSVFVINDILVRTDIDFPKSMMVEVLLIFGLLGLPVLAYILARVVGRIQFIVKRFSPTDPQFILALYVLPGILQFEKEFSGFLFSLIKWAPMVIFIIVSRPTIRVNNRKPGFLVDV